MIHYKHVEDSETKLTELMVPHYANFGGKVHGGTLLSFMDKAAYVCATKHAGNYCVTVTVDKVEFLDSVEVGEVVSFYTSVNHVGNTSLVIGIKVVAENIKTGTVKHTNSSYFTMVAVDENGKPTQVPGLILNNHDEVRRFWESEKRKELKAVYKNEFRKAVNISVEDMLKDLQGRKCKIDF